MYPLYCLYNKISKPVHRNESYVNQNKDKAHCKIDIRIEQHLYEINRQTSIQRVKKRNGEVEQKSITSVSFSCDGENRNAIDRADTDKEIRKVFGSAEDFMRTSVAPQFDLLGFVSDKATDRKKTIGRYFDLDLFELKHKFANDELKSYQMPTSKSSVEGL